MTQWSHHSCCSDNLYAVRLDHKGPCSFVSRPMPLPHSRAQLSNCANWRRLRKVCTWFSASDEATIARQIVQISGLATIGAERLDVTTCMSESSRLKDTWCIDALYGLPGSFPGTQAKLMMIPLIDLPSYVLPLFVHTEADGMGLKILPLVSNLSIIPPSTHSVIECYGSAAYRLWSFGNADSLHESWKEYGSSLVRSVYLSSRTLQQQLSTYMIYMARHLQGRLGDVLANQVSGNKILPPPNRKPKLGMTRNFGVVVNDHWRNSHTSRRTRDDGFCMRRREQSMVVKHTIRWQTRQTW